MREVDAIVEAYLRRWPTEAGRLAELRGFLREHYDGARIARTNFAGHLTASAFIVNTAHDAMLLVRHKKLGRWLQPGGHVDTGDAGLVAAALREAEEETGVRREVLQLATGEGVTVPLDIDSHRIPANATRGEVAHTHHDFSYLFLHHGDDASLAACTVETEGFRWAPLEQLSEDAEFGLVAGKVREVLG